MKFDFEVADLKDSGQIWRQSLMLTFFAISAEIES